MVIATWNVNSLRARFLRVEEFLSEHKPDVLLLQETKCSPEQFPAEEIAACGYKAVDHSGGRWCGVAILTPTQATVKEVVVGLSGEPNPDEARWIEATIDGIRVVSVYVPNGREVDSEHFKGKLAFFKNAADRVSDLAANGPLLVAGDMNVALNDNDVWDIAAFDGATHVTAAEREGLGSMLSAGPLTDAHVSLHGDEQQFTWWDYRGGSFHRGMGMRIDHILLTDDLTKRLESCEIARDYRKGEKPSDHVPLIVTLAS